MTTQVQHLSGQLEEQLTKYCLGLTVLSTDTRTWDLCNNDAFRCINVPENRSHFTRCVLSLFRYFDVSEFHCIEDISCVEYKLRNLVRYFSSTLKRKRSPDWNQTNLFPRLFAFTFMKFSNSSTLVRDTCCNLFQGGTY